MSRFMSYCRVALACELLSVGSTFGGDRLAAPDHSPVGSLTTDAQKPEATKPAGDANNPFTEGAAPRPHAATKVRTTLEAKKPGSRVAQPSNPAEPAETRIRQALDQPTQIEFVETPLKDVVDYLKDLHHIEIQLDSAALKEAGVEEATPVTHNLKGISLRSALQLLLAQIDGEVTYAIHNEVLLITTKAKAKTLLVTKLYDVADLAVCQDNKAKFWDDYETLTDVIKETAPPSWDFNGGQGTAKGASLGAAKVLVISQTQQVHEEIAAMLKEIRSAAAANRDKGVVNCPQRDPPAEPARGRPRSDFRPR